MIFVLGGKGLVGSAFARYCERTGRPFTIIDRDEYAAYAGKACEVLVNANGNSSKRLADTNPLGEFDASVRSVRAALADFRFDRYVQISTCDVYPDCSGPETTRESAVIDPAVQSAYGFHKHLAEQCVRHAGRDWLIFRCGGFVGPGLRKNAIFDILRGGPLYLDPASELQFLHTDRAAEIVFQVLETGASREVFNLCGKGTVRLADVAERVGGTIPVAPGSPRVRYEIGLEKLSRLVEPPETRSAVFDFVAAELRERRAGA
jgi:nucleoside-diphosphate-sugar epimerase